MTKIYVSSDFHLGHKRILEMSERPFKNIDDMDNTIIPNMLEPLKENDDFYFLGDFSWDINLIQLFFERFKLTKANFHWIIGNHDKKMVKQFKHQCTSISPMKEISIKNHYTVMCHYPLLTWNRSHRNAFMLYGHHHHLSHGTLDLQNNLARGKMLNINLEFHNYKPWTEKEICDYMKDRPNNWDYILPEEKKIQEGRYDREATK